MITIRTLRELEEQCRPRDLVPELMKLVEPRRFQRNHAHDPEKHRIVGQTSDDTARLCALTKQLFALRRSQPRISDEEDALVLRISAQVAKAKQKSLRKDCKDAQPPITRKSDLFVSRGGLIATSK